jgi:hypothetical protein
MNRPDRVIEGHGEARKRARDRAAGGKTKKLAAREDHRAEIVHLGRCWRFMPRLAIDLSRTSAPFPKFVIHRGTL